MLPLVHSSQVASEAMFYFLGTKFTHRVLAALLTWEGLRQKV